MDLFEEKIQGDKYEFEDKLLPLRIVKENIKVKGQDDVEVVFRSTHHGPVLDHINSFFHNV